MGLNFSGFVFIKIETPSEIFPSPIASKPKKGINKPPINNPTALIVSETATAFKPPKIA